MVSNNWLREREDSEGSEDYCLRVSNEQKEVIRSHNLHKTYLLGLEGVPALRGVSLSIFKGEYIVVYGTSGSGKSTMLSLLGTIDTPTKGTLSICATAVDSKTSERNLSGIRLNSIGFVFQAFNLIGSMTVQENVELPMVLAGTSSLQERRARSTELMRSVGMLSRKKHLPSQLSGGEQQRVTIARALANNPTILLLDEPTGDLDTNTTYIIMDLLIKANQAGITCVMVTHDSHLKNVAHRAVHMRDGKIVEVEEIPEENRTEFRQIMETKAREAEKKQGGGFSELRPAQADIATPAGQRPVQWTRTTSRTPRNYSSSAAFVRVLQSSAC
eukprot:GCRY01001668.1.p1 GENE.GCRY01001668.1~~GCRY01001668.1.p1  ORF type:complete len:330 (-),score=46.21 GCRY01001668.1:309-1298(-)